MSTPFHQGWPKIKCSIDQNCCLLTGCFGQLVIWFLVILDKMMLAFKSYFSVTQPHTNFSVCNKIKFWDQKCILWINNKWEMEQSQFILANFIYYLAVWSVENKSTHIEKCLNYKMIRFLNWKIVHIPVSSMIFGLYQQK